MADTEQTNEQSNAKTTPVWGYNDASEAKIFHLKGDEILPEGWHESPARAAVEGKDQAAEREHRAALERRAEAVKLTIDAAWDVTRLEAEIHRAEAIKGTQTPPKVKRAEDPDAEDNRSDERKEAERLSKLPPVGESAAERAGRNRRIDERKDAEAEAEKHADALKEGEKDEAEKSAAKAKGGK